MLNPENRERPDSYTLSDLQDRIKKFKRDQGQAYMGRSYEERQQIDLQTIIDLLEELKSQKDRFKQVFVTEKGSTYFVLNSGESFRIKKHDNGTLTPEIMMEKIFYIGKDDSDELFKQLQAGKLLESLVINKPIRKVQIAAGVTPIEIGLASRPNENVIEETPDDFTIKGQTVVNYGDPFEQTLSTGKKVMVGKNDSYTDESHIDGFHFGHEVKEVEKS